MLKPNQTVMIYEYPITKEKPEGKAKLLKLYKPDEGDGLSLWLVCFEDEPNSKYVRTVYDDETTLVINDYIKKD